jgi:hypothetical protein
MLNKILKIIFAGPKIAPTYCSQLLGEFEFDRGTHSWTVKKQIGDSSVTLTVGGKRTPDQQLLKIIEEYYREFSSFEQRIRDFLQEESLKQEEYAGEISNLKIEEIMFTRPDEPDHGMVFFTGPDHHKCWHLDLVKGKPGSLCFDD